MTTNTAPTFAPDPMQAVAEMRDGSTFRMRGRVFEKTSGCFTRAADFVEVPVFNEAGTKTTVRVRWDARVEVVHSVTAAEVMRRA